MFSRNSRYAGLETVKVRDSMGREVSAVKLRRLPVTEAEDYVVQDFSQLDIISYQRYRDGTRYWHIADANSELEAETLVCDSNRLIKVPGSL